MSDKPGIDKNVFSPSQIAEATVNAIKNAKENPDHLKIGFSQLDDHFVMAKPRKVIGILADTSHGKTSFMTAIARNFVPQLAKNEIGVFATWEDSVEDFGLADIANVSKIPVASLFHGDVNEAQFSKMLNAAAQRAATPLWLVGHSEEFRAGRPRLTMLDLWEAMDNIVVKQGRKVRFVMLDYLQRISRQDMKRDDARLQFSEIMDSIKDLSLAYGCTAFIGSQVGRHVRERKWRQPQVHDAMETSNYEHTCDAMISLWMPSKSDNLKLGESMEAKEGVTADPINVTKELLRLETLKQKKGDSNVGKYLDFIPEFNMFVKHGTANKVRKEIANGTYTD
jgi:replicative DNA helicase